MLKKLIEELAYELLEYTEKKKHGKTFPEVVVSKKEGAKSHTDHGLTKKQLRWVKGVTRREGSSSGEVTVKTHKLPRKLRTTFTGLHGPAEGDKPVSDSETSMEPRSGRAYPSRLTTRPARSTRNITMIAGPSEAHPKKRTVYTAFGGASAPQEPNDPRVKDRGASERFWSKHALSKDASPPKKK